MDEPAQAGASAVPPPRSSAVGTASCSSQGALAATPNPWREEVSYRLERFRDRRRAQQSLPLNFDSREPASGTAGSPARRFLPEQLRRVIPFETRSGGTRTSPPQFREPLATKGAPSEGRSKSEASSRPGAPPIHRSRAPVPSLSQGSLRFPEPLPSPSKPASFPVAPLVARILAGVADATVLVGGYALFIAVYALLGGGFPLQHIALFALGAGLAFLALSYMALFLYFSGATPGMRWIGLRLVDLDGLPAHRELRLVRLLGLLASTASLGVGFLWAAVDEDGLTWHDRISQTCLTLSDAAARRNPHRA